MWCPTSLQYFMHNKERKNTTSGLSLISKDNELNIFIYEVAQSQSWRYNVTKTDKHTVKEVLRLICGPGAAVLADAIFPRFAVSLVVEGQPGHLQENSYRSFSRRSSLILFPNLEIAAVVYNNIYNLIPYSPRAWILKTSMGWYWSFNYSPICPISGKKWDVVFSHFWGRSISY